MWKRPQIALVIIDDMKNFQDKKTKLLLHKLGYFRLEIESKRAELEDHERDFNERYQANEPPPPPPTPDEQQGQAQDPPPDDAKSSPEGSASSNEAQSSSNEPETPKPIAPDEIRKIWKQIAVKTHPDKTGNDPDLTDVYKRALAAYNNGNYEEIIDIAIQLFIKIDALSDETLAVLESRAVHLEKELKQINDNALWTWVKASDEKKSKIENMLRKYRKIKNSKRKN